MFAAVESDVVGYTQIEMQAGKWYMVGNPFGDLADKTTLPVSDIYSDGFAEGDILNILDPSSSTYSAYYWNAQLSGWSILPGVPIAADVSLEQGQAVYIYKSSFGTVSLKGKVVEVSVPFGKEEGGAWNQIVPMWPKEQAVNSLKWTNMQDGDTLNVLNIETSTFDAYYWNASIQKWTILPGVPIEANVVLFPGQAVFVNKVSKGIGTLSH